MRIVMGRVVVAETDIGLPNLLVSVMSDGPAGAVGTAGAAAERVGSVLTDARGGFELRYDDGSADKKWSLRLAVFAGGDSSSLEDALYVDPRPRVGAGRVESYLVRIPRALLTRASLAVPADAEHSPELAAERLATRGQLVDVARKRIATAGAARLAEPRKQWRLAEQALRAALVTRGRVAPPPPAGDVAERLKSAIQRTVQRRVHGSRVRARLPVTGEQRAALKAAADETGRVPAPVILPLLFGDLADAERVYASPLVSACRDQTLPEATCAEAPQPEGEGGTDGSSGGGNGEPDQRSIPDAVWSVLASGATVPDASRPNPDDIARSVGALSLKNGPADVPAYFDFPNLQIAFEHVWAEAFDEDVLATAMDLYRTVVELGGEVPLDSEPLEVLRVLDAEARLLLAHGISDTNGPSAGGVVHDHRKNTHVSAHYGENADSAPARLAALMAELDERLAEPYRFTVFAADESGTSVNFGVVVTYRQQWEPLPSQVGKAVDAITLAPREERSYSVKQVVQRKRRAETKERFKELLRDEETTTARSVRDLVESAQRQTGFQASYTGSIGASFSTQASTSSQETRQNFREAVFKAAREAESEREIQISSETSDETTSERSGKLANGNDELAVTYFFYELQRRFRVSESIHKITPVMLVAQPVPLPHEISIAWLIQHDWILRRVLLDSSFAPGLAYLSEGLASDDLATDALRKNVEGQRELVESLQDNLTTIRAESGERYTALEKAIAKRAAILASEASESFLNKAGDYLFGGDVSPEAAQLREDMARDAYERIARAERELTERIAHEVSTLESMTERLLDAQKKMLDRKVEVARLRLHVKQNILHYMQAIWDHEPPDQRYFRLHQIQVPRVRGQLSYQLVPDPDAMPMPPSWEAPETVEITATLEDPDEWAPLVELADLDRPLGYKGNYMILPLLESNVLTDYMMAPYVDARSGVRDPDDIGNFTLSALKDYVCCLQKSLPAEDFAQLLPGIHAAYQRILTNPHPSEEEIVVPTGLLLIEPMTGTQPVIEDYKLRSRALDVVKAAAEVRRTELDNLRRAARILSDDLSDPDIERVVQVQGTPNVVVGDE